ncbi:hypothetical protein TIFTF001_024002 [Ficus carica]|uniref:Uncharacterized protein n=1 Tax=Ficus carica TaxID=3494 RepID=A0AA88ALV6_FICCA|nr:hypothetical protein TIFTF001_024002 [Ficus carica]
MILTEADPMAKAANRSVATRLAYFGVRSQKAAENSAQQEVRVEMTGKIPTAAMVKARRRCWVEETFLLDAAIANEVAISGEPPQMPPPPAKSPSSTIPPEVASPPNEVAISCEPPQTMPPIAKSPSPASHPRCCRPPKEVAISGDPHRRRLPPSEPPQPPSDQIPPARNTPRRPATKPPYPARRGPKKKKPMSAPFPPTDPRQYPLPQHPNVEPMPH